MVHALEIVHRLLTPGGVILNVHDLPEPAPVDVRGDGRVVRVGELDDDSDYALLHYTDEALQAVVTAGLFTVEARVVFAYETHMDSRKTFDDWYAGTWESTTFSALDHQRLQRALDAVEGAPTIVTHRRAGMTCLKRRGEATAKEHN